MIGHIYCLKSRNGRIIYVGQTTMSLHLRLNIHFGSRCSGTKIANYFLKCKNRPTIHLLETINFRKKHKLNEAEEKWVRYFRSNGINLLNDSTYGLYSKKTKRGLYTNHGKCPVCGSPHLKRPKNGKKVLL